MSRAVYLALADHSVKAIVLLGLGGLVVGTNRYLLYPTLVGSSVRRFKTANTHWVIIILLRIGRHGKCQSDQGRAWTSRSRGLAYLAADLEKG